ncbi:hypothetical protein BT69DRAFT_1275613 [Atractiella rhizophila]|nr:hypothetical protein BT69DRAFT_1275613 [Atractiella rhizophila]
MSPPAPTAPEQPDLALQSAAIEDILFTKRTYLTDNVESTTLDASPSCLLLQPLLGYLGLHIGHVPCLAQS